MSRHAARSRALELFHPAVRTWFSRALGEPSAPQLAGWPLIAAREHTLIAAPTGSGKTLAAFLSALNELIELGLDSQLEDRCYVLYVSPLKALSNDVEKNLQIPLEGIREELKAQGLPDVSLRVSVRTGDTASSERARMLKKPPHVLVTTPESLYILLTSRGGRELLKGVRTLIVDEIHALVRDKRGSHLALSIERLEALAPGFVRVGLSATQKPIERVAAFLGGEESRGRARPVHIVDTGHKRHLDLAIEVPPSPLEAVMAGEVWEEIYDRVAELIREHKTTLVFVNTRRVAERVTRHLATRLGEDKVTSHHGSLSREQRFRAEQRLKSGELSALVATASLELGIDVGAVELVCQLGSTRSIATLLQRVGRAGHSLGGVPKGRVFPLSRDELVEQVALLHAFERGELDRVQIPDAPLDILAQQLVAAVAAEEEWQSDALFALVRRAYPYRDLSREVFDGILEMLADGFTTRRGRRGAHLHYDRVGELLKPRRGARLTAMTNGGAIPDTFDYEVVADPGGYFVGTINEDFAIESMAGDIFQLGNASWRIVKVEPGRVRVEDARGLPPSIPFWLGEAPARTDELSLAVSRLRAEVDDALSALPESPRSSPPTSAELERLAERFTSPGIPKAAASQFIEYLAAAHQALGCLPTQDTLVLERFFDESGGMQLVLHAPFGGRVNRAWGLSLRKRFCQRFNFELQAAATEDALILSLGPTHSFPLEEVFRYLHPNTVRPLLIQALLVAPMFETRWRWNATRSLAISRFRGGSRVPPRLQRMNAADLLTLVFPDQVACQENLEGPREVPEHPLVQQTVNDCLVEAMDVSAFEAVLAAVVGGEKRLVARDLTEPSPLSLEILSARPYAFLDDAPLEERRTQAVSARRWLSPSQASELGALDPEAIARVQEEAWPTVRDADELADALQVLGAVSQESAGDLGWRSGLEALAQTGRVTLATTRAGRGLWIAVERLVELRAAYPGAAETPLINVPQKLVPNVQRSREEILVELVRGQVECRGPIRAATLAHDLALPAEDVELALLTLETEGFVLRGSFTRQSGEQREGHEWCERGLLARIHRYTLARLRSEIEPVQQTDFMRFLLRWQRVEPGYQGSGPDALAQVLDQLEGFEAPAAAWEQEILPARIADYDPAWLDLLCLSGRVTWLRRTPPQSTGARRAKPAPVRATPVALVSRTNLEVWCAGGQPSDEGSELSSAAARVQQVLQASGACFFMDLMGRSGLLRTQVEEGLAELVALGLANSDSFAGLRALIVPSAQRGQMHRRHGRRAGQGMELGGRWSLFDVAVGHGSNLEPDAAWNQTEQIARRLLVRWGVVFRKLVEREAGLPPWRDLVRVLRRLEARGELRGGRFVAGFSGEQYALPEAVSQLRALRRETSEPVLVSISAADPLNLRGLTVAGERVPALLTNRLCFRAGEVVGTKQGRNIQVIEAEESWVIRQTLVRTGALAGKTANARLGWRGNRSQQTH